MWRGKSQQQQQGVRWPIIQLDCPRQLQDINQRSPSANFPLSQEVPRNDDVGSNEIWEYMNAAIANNKTSMYLSTSPSPSTVFTVSYFDVVRTN